MRTETNVWLASVAAGIALTAAGCVSASTRRTIASAEAVASSVRPGVPPGAAQPPGRTRAPPTDTALARSVDLPSLEAAALARHPSLIEAAHRVRALAAQARAEGSLPSPQLMADLWQVPLERPYAVQDAGMLMISVRQEIPAPGSLDRAMQAAALEARAAAAMVAAAARALLRDVAHAFAQYVEATEQQRVQRAHLMLLDQMAAAARARYAAGGALSDIVRPDLERASVEARLAREVGRIEEARAALNALLARPADAPLGLPRNEDSVTTAWSAPQAVARAEAVNPEIVAADAMRAAAQSTAEAARREGQIPSFMVGLSYFHPVGVMPAGWGASIGMSIPWLWGPEPKRAEASEFRALAETASAQTMRLRVRGEAAKALAGVDAAARRLLTLRERALPAAARALEATRAGYAAGATDILMWLDAARGALEVELEVNEARGDLDRALADLDFAVGERVPRAPLRHAPLTLRPQEHPDDDKGSRSGSGRAASGPRRAKGSRSESGQAASGPRRTIRGG